MVRQACILIRVYLKLARRSVRNPTLLYLSICIVLFLGIPFVMLWRAGALGIVIQMISLKVHSLLPETVHLTFAGIFWFWLFLPFFVKVRYASAEGYDRLSLYPLDFRRFYILT